MVLDYLGRAHAFQQDLNGVCGKNVCVVRKTEPVVVQAIADGKLVRRRITDDLSTYVRCGGEAADHRS